MFECRTPVFAVLRDAKVIGEREGQSRMGGVEGKLRLELSRPPPIAGVEKCNARRTGQFYTGVARFRRSDASGFDNPQACLVIGKRFQPLRRGIARAVIHHNRFDIAAALRGHR